MDRAALDALLAMPERNRFLRGMTVWIGFTQTAVRSEREARTAGGRSSRCARMLRFSFDAIASFSYCPLQLATLLGFVFSAIAFLAIPLTSSPATRTSSCRGIPSTIVVILLLGGIQLITLGIIGEYVGRIYDEVKRRPLYVVREHEAEPRADREGRGPRGRRVRPHRRAAARARPGTRSTSTSAGPGSAGRRRRSTSAAATGSSATTTTCSPPTATSPRSTTSWGCRTSWSGGLHRRVLRRRQQWPFTTPLDLLRFRPLPPLDACAWALAVLAVQRFAERPGDVRGHHGARVDRAAHGPAAWDNVWGPLLRGKFGDRAEDIAMVWLWNKLPLRRQGEEARGEKLGYPRRLVGAAARALRARSGARRARADRPPAARLRDDDGLEVTCGAPGSFRGGHDPRRSSRPAPSATTACWPPCPTTYSRGWPACRSRRSSTTPRSACCWSSTARSPFYWTNVADRELPFVGLIEHTNFVEPERYDGRRFLYVANYLPHGHELLRSTPTSCSSATSPACARSTRRSTAPGSGALASASPPPSRSSPSATGADPPLRRRAGAGPRQHDPGLSRGPRHQLRRADRRRGRRGAAAVIALGVDVGGTFTDAVLVTDDDMDDAKVLSTRAPGGGVVDAARGARARRLGARRRPALRPGSTVAPTRWQPATSPAPPSSTTGASATWCGPGPQGPRDEDGCGLHH